MFRFKRNLPIGYDRQGYIYFASKMYSQLPDHQRKIIRAVCAEAGGEYKEAVFDFVTTDHGATQVCMTHHISESTLERAVRKYYILFPIA